MNYLRGVALFVAGVILGRLATGTSVASREKLAGVTLNHVGVNVKDLDGSITFYTKTMGFRPAFSFKDKQGKTIQYLQINRDTFFELTAADVDHPVGVSHVGIVADDLKTTISALQQKGVKVDDAIVGSTKAPLSNLIDPNGIRLELLDFAPESLQKKAVDAWK